MNAGIARAGRREAAPVDRRVLVELLRALGHDPETSTAVLITRDAVRVATQDGRDAVTYLHPVVDLDVEAAS